jgi:hypothetical protein
MINSLGCSEFRSSPFKCLYKIIMGDYSLNRKSTEGKKETVCCRIYLSSICMLSFSFLIRSISALRLWNVECVHQW